MPYVSTSDRRTDVQTDRPACGLKASFMPIEDLRARITRLNVRDARIAVPYNIVGIFVHEIKS